MKKSNYIIALVLSAASIASSCSKHDMAEMNIPATLTKTVTFNTEVMVKSAVDTDGKIHFTETEKFTPYVWSEGTSTNLSKQFSILRGENGAVSVTHNLTDAQAYNYGFVSPASNANGFDGTNYTVTLPAVQQPVADGSTFDPKADILISELVNLSADANGEAIARFKRMFTFLKVTIPGNDNDFKPRYSSERLISFEVKALDNTPLSGTATIPATNNYDECVATFVKPSNSVEATFNADIDFKEDRYVWLVVNPATFTGLELVLHTQSGKYTRTFENFECEFKPGTVNKLTFKHHQNNNGDPVVAENSRIINGVRYIQTASANTKVDASADYGLSSMAKAADLNVLMLTKKSATYDFALSNQGLTKDAVFIGVTNEVNSAEKVGLKITQRNQLRNPGGLIAFKNLKLDLTSLTSEAFRLATSGNDIGGIREIIIEDCDIYMTQSCFLSIYGSPADSGIESIVVRNCKIFYTPSKKEDGSYPAAEFINLNNSSPVLTQSGAEKYKSIIFDNNVIHWTNGTAIEIQYGFSRIYSNINDSAFTNLDVQITNNTFVEVVGVSSRGIATFTNMTDKSVRSILIDRNVFYSSRTTGYPPILAIKYNSDNNWYRYMFDKTTNYAEGYQGVKLYYEPNDNSWAYPAEGKGATLAKKANILPNLADGSYKINSNYTGYGSSLE